MVCGGISRGTADLTTTATAPAPLPPTSAPHDPPAKKARLCAPTPPGTPPPDHLVAASSKFARPSGQAPLIGAKKEASTKEELLQQVSRAPDDLGSKGYGKGNFGVAVPPPEHVPFYAKEEASSSAARSDVAQAPDPIKPTQQEVDEWMQTFTPFDATHCTPPEIGQEVLWRGFKQTRSGNPSTKLEYFNGTVRDLVFEGNELFCM